MDLSRWVFLVLVISTLLGVGKEESKEREQVFLILHIERTHRLRIPAVVCVVFRGVMVWYGQRCLPRNVAFGV
ncbi:MAG: hypothetical protein JWR35_3895 [Marmoricola sp.]|nr:hypothetical protein [Marmoricola sp.]